MSIAKYLLILLKMTNRHVKVTIAQT